MLLNRHIAAGGVVVYKSPQLAAVGVGHAFSTRVGGVSGPPFDSMNLGNPMGADVQDSAANLAENYGRFMAASGLAGVRRHWTWQVHGAGGDGGRAGGVCRRVQSRCAGDDRAGAGGVGAVGRLLPGVVGNRGRAGGWGPFTPGWRGAVAGVAAAAVGELCRVAGVGPGEIVAAVGPCIGFEAFEVGPEVLAAFASQFGEDAVRRDGDGGKGHADLPTGVFRSLATAGVPADHIDTTDRCSVRDAGEFFSHRRDHGTTGRMAAVVGIQI